MEQTYQNLQKNGQNNVDNLITWMKESKVISQSQEPEARSFFSGADANNVSYQKFTSVVDQIASSQRTDTPNLMQKLAQNAGHVSRLISTGTAMIRQIKGLFSSNPSPSMSPPTAPSPSLSPPTAPSPSFSPPTAPPAPPLGTSPERHHQMSSESTLEGSSSQTSEDSSVNSDSKTS